MDIYFLLFQAKYQVKTEYRDSDSPNQDTTHRSNSSNHHPDRVRRDSYGLYKDQQARRSYRRSQSEEVYTIPQTEQTMLHPSQSGYLGIRGAQHPNPAELWSRQTSMDTSYNVPSIRTDMGEELGPGGLVRMGSGSRQHQGRFDSIAEVTESQTRSNNAVHGVRNQGYNL